MLQQTAATIESLPEAIAVLKEMGGKRIDLDISYRPLTRRTMAQIIEEEMECQVSL